MIAFATVALGGFGSVEGSFVAGILIGIIESLGGFFISPAVKYAIVFMTYHGGDHSATGHRLVRVVGSVALDRGLYYVA